MDKIDFVKIVKDKYHSPGNVCFKANALHLNSDGSEEVRQGYVVDTYFIDLKNLYIFEKSYFNMINNIEDDDLL